jgi:hypothetical protein
MDLPRFVAMLGLRTLWFAKAAGFEDGYEGFCQVQRRQMPEIDPLAKAITRTTASGETGLITLTEALVEMAGLSADYFDNAREHLYVNSWCMAEESMAMWEIYGARGCGIAVKSTVGQYRRAARFQPVDQVAAGLTEITPLSEALRKTRVMRLVFFRGAYRDCLSTNNLRLFDGSPVDPLTCPCPQCMLKS